MGPIKEHLHALSIRVRLLDKEVSSNSTKIKSILSPSALMQILWRFRGGGVVVVYEYVNADTSSI